jgi:hypothetical protein
MAFTRRCIITPETGKVPSAQSNYAVLIYVQHNDLRTVGNGGYVQDAQGDDIRVFGDGALSSALSFYRLRYNGTTGLFIARAKIPTLQVGSPYYLGFGDASLTADASDAANTFSNSYAGVWPFEDGSTLNVADVSGNGRTTTNINSTAAGTALLGAGADLDGSNDHIHVDDFHAGDHLTLTAFIKPDVVNAVKVIFAKRLSMTGHSGVGGENYLMYTQADGKVSCRAGTNAGIDLNGPSVVSSSALSVDTPYVLHFTFNGSVFKVYINGTEVATANHTSTIRDDTGPIHFGDDGTAGRFFNGHMRMFEISGAGRSADWCATDYNCWIDPSAFASYSFDDAPVGSKGAHYFYSGGF